MTTLKSNLRIRGLHWLVGLFRRPELMVFVPAVTLAAFWMGGERMLILTALAAPLFFALGGSFRFANSDSNVPPDALTGLAMRPQIVSLMDDILRDTPVSGLTTACLVVQFDDAAALVDRSGRRAGHWNCCWQSETRHQAQRTMVRRGRSGSASAPPPSRRPRG